jgi:hypothetical protein
MQRGLIETYIRTLLETDETLQREFAAVGGGAVQGVVAEPTVLPFRRKRRKKKRA